MRKLILIEGNFMKYGWLLKDTKDNQYRVIASSLKNAVDKTLSEEEQLNESDIIYCKKEIEL